MMKKTMLLTTTLFLIGAIASAAAYGLTRHPFFSSMAITFGTCFYHLVMRLTVACLINARFHNIMDYTRTWFQERAFEPHLYKFLRVKQWKHLLPSFHPETFILHKNSIQQMIQATCQAEIVHEVIMAFSFVPVLCSVWFGEMEVFLITSCLSALLDGLFVIIQRYNRPRLTHLMK